MRTSRLRKLPWALLCLTFCLASPSAWGESGDDAAPNTGGRGWLRHLSRFRLPDENERNHPEVRAAFRDVVRETSRCTVRVLADGRQVALGTIVRSDGLILTKASELGERVECHLADGRRLEAQTLAQHRETDLALLKVEAVDLPTVQWAQADSLIVGSWLATASLDETPTAIGVMSAPTHAVPNPRAVLGVLLEDAEQGARIDRVMPRSPASQAGLQTGDIVQRIDGEAVASRDALIKAIEDREPGQQVELSILRDQDSLAIKATLGDLAHVGNPDQAELMDSLGGPLSKRRHGFPEVVQHDSVLRPRDCGGPVVGLDGKVVGINIARASRVASYALPVSQIRPVLETLMQQTLQPVARQGALDEVRAEP